MPEGRLILKKPLMYSDFFLWVKHIRMLRCWWAWWEFITLFSWYFMHVWNFLLQKRRMIRAENFNFSITYLSCVSFFSDNAIHNVWYQTCPDLQFSFTFPTFSSAVNTQHFKNKWIGCCSWNSVRLPQTVPSGPHNYLRTIISHLQTDKYIQSL